MPGTAITKSVVANEPGGRKREEIFVDIIEKISVTFSSSGYILTSEIDGTIQMKSYLTGNAEIRVGCTSMPLSKVEPTKKMMVLDDKAPSIDQISSGHISMVCTSAVKESVANPLNSPAAPDLAMSCSHKPCDCSVEIEGTRSSDSILNQLVLTGETNQVHSCSYLVASGSGYGQSILGGGLADAADNQLSEKGETKSNNARDAKRRKELRERDAKSCERETQRGRQKCKREKQRERLKCKRENQRERLKCKRELHKIRRLKSRCFGCRNSYCY
ncbi:hypothetical protein H6P81_015953 [Aristolochia fimbriata]|uniref:MHD domain-containing protein n=1 Tax=Aristolochia fimbriata TaxID=158543 RepID=A0AAV7E7E6_ARIFI|nr:hypothetical protein H6P81_015953 [Aristolochia fimbriata]